MGQTRQTPRRVAVADLPFDLFEVAEHRGRGGVGKAAAVSTRKRPDERSKASFLRLIERRDRLRVGNRIPGSLCPDQFVDRPEKVCLLRIPMMSDRHSN